MFKKGVKRAEMSNVIDVYVNGTVGQVGSFRTLDYVLLPPVSNIMIILTQLLAVMGFLFVIFFPYLLIAGHGDFCLGKYARKATGAAYIIRTRPVDQTTQCCSSEF